MKRIVKGRYGTLLAILAGITILGAVILALSVPTYASLALSIAALGILLFLVGALAVSVKTDVADARTAIRSLTRDADAWRPLRTDTINTARSVGRMAPTVRQIEAGVQNLTATQDEISRAPAVLPVGKSTTSGKAANVARFDLAAFPALTYPEREPKRPEVSVMTILDEFTETAFGFEWVQHPATPDNWRDILNTNKVDMLFVESAWNANSGAWLYHLVGQSAPRPAIMELVRECQRKGIPAVFWNKEDPPHFEDFLPTAKLFDVVLTTDGTLIDEYRRRLGHDHVYVLPFAAQPAIHNPGRVASIRRDSDVAFGGMYFRDKYPERRVQLDYLLPAAAKFKVDIFSRHAGADTRYQFPEEFEKYVRGGLSYPQMLTAYHKYKVFLNVNSVVTSPTMCARRIFEISASGAAVVSAPSPAISNFFDDGEVLVASTEEDAYHEIRALIRSAEYRDRVVHRAQRRIWRHHTYSHRVGSILGYAGLADDYRPPTVSVIAPTVRPHNIGRIFDSVARQSRRPDQLILLAHGFEPEPRELEARARSLGIDSFVLLTKDRTSTLGECLNAMVAASEGDILAKFDDDDFYGPCYLEDLLYALDFSGADVVGKAATYIYVESADATVLTYAAHEHRNTDFVRGATLTGRREVFEGTGFPHLPRSEDSGFLKRVLSGGGSIYSADRFNFVVNRHRDPASHTWRSSDRALFASGDMHFSGDGRDAVTV